MGSVGRQMGASTAQQPRNARLHCLPTGVSRLGCARDPVDCSDNTGGCRPVRRGLEQGTRRPLSVPPNTKCIVDPPGTRLSKRFVAPHTPITGSPCSFPFTTLPHRVSFAFKSLSPDDQCRDDAPSGDGDQPCPRYPFQHGGSRKSDCSN